ncbi:hypothetical protein G7054_g11929 [Neopestalotiopsis clavispora]|nr:hypothetical protein G7054_g11929 [Neopestalotiopsis clavispora]
MASSKLGVLPSLGRQHLLTEFAGLKQACPEGIFVSLTPGDPSLWSGVLFVRDDIFHPLVTPLTTYMYTTDVQDNGTVSATDDERLPPGGFSLRHGFPDWFGRRMRTADAVSHSVQTPPRQVAASLSSGKTSSSKKSASAVGDSPGTFDDEDVLDLIPLEAAGNPGAWHAWRTRQRSNGREFPDNDGSEDSTPTPAGASKKPGEWNWEGVWEERVKKGIAASLSESVLYGGVGAGEDVIHFLSMEENDIETVKGNLLRTLAHTPS